MSKNPLPAHDPNDGEARRSYSGDVVGGLAHRGWNDTANGKDDMSPDSMPRQPNAAVWTWIHGADADK